MKAKSSLRVVVLIIPLTKLVMSESTLNVSSPKRIVIIVSPYAISIFKAIKINNMAIAIIKLVNGGSNNISAPLIINNYFIFRDRIIYSKYILF